MSSIQQKVKKVSIGDLLGELGVERQLTMDEKRDIVISLLDDGDLNREQMQILSTHLGEPIMRIVRWKFDVMVKSGAMAKKVRQLRSEMRNGASIRRAARWVGMSKSAAHRYLKGAS